MMGVSVLSGCITSMGASIMLFFCTLQFFSKFGGFLFATVILSWLWANFFFLPVLGVVGPNVMGGSKTTPAERKIEGDNPGGVEMPSQPAPVVAEA